MTAWYTLSLVPCLMVVVCAAPAQSASDALKAGEHSVIALQNIDLNIYRVKERLVAQPANSEIRFELARLLGQADRYVEALAEYNTLIRAHAYDVDYSLGRAQVLAWLGNDTAALVELERAKILAPNYEAVWQLRFLLLRRQQPTADSPELAALCAEAEARFPQSQWWQTSPPERDIRWYLTLSGTHESLSNDLPSWSNLHLQLDWIRNQNASYFGRLARDARFDNSDRQFALGGEWRFRANWSAGLEFNASPAADFQPKSGFSVHAGYQLSDGWRTDIRWRQRRYDTATVSTYSGTAERYFKDYRAAYSLNVSRLHGLGNTLAHTLTLDWYFSPQHSLRLTVSDGEEAEAVGTGQVLQTSVNNVTLSGRHRLKRRLTLSWWVGSHRQGDFYRRSYVGLAATVGI